MESVLDTSSQCYGLYPVTPSLSQMWKLSPRMVHNYAQTASPQSLRFMICLGSKARPSDDGLNTFHPHDPLDTEHFIKAVSRLEIWYLDGSN